MTSAMSSVRVGGGGPAVARSRCDLAAAKTSALADAAQPTQAKLDSNVPRSRIGNTARRSTYMNVAARRRTQRRQAVTAKHRGRRLLLAAALRQPRREIGPPGIAVGFRRRHPTLGSRSSTLYPRGMRPSGYRAD